MIAKFIELLTGLVKDKAWWPRVEPAFHVLSLYVVACVIAYQYVEWRYHFTPELGTFLASYLVKQISVVFVAVALLAVAGGVRLQRGATAAAVGRVGTWVRSSARTLAVAGVIVVIATAVFLRLVPHEVNHIRVTFLDAPKSFKQEAFAYIVYELNRAQAGWHFTLDGDTFNKDALSTTDTARCGDDSFCYAEILAHDQPFIGIAEVPFTEDSFWKNLGVVSVVSAGQWTDYEPPSTYEFLSYSLIVQSMLIHLNQGCGGLPSGAFQRSRASFGDLFEFAPRRYQMKAAILAAHLSPKGQELLANCFGLEYMNVCSELLSLDWLHSGRVHDNLKKTFGVEL